MIEKYKLLNKKTKIYIIIILAALLILALGTTYAFFLATGLNGPSAELEVTTEDTENLYFTPGSPIDLKANLTNFSEGAGSLTGQAVSSATYVASEGKKEDYYVYFNIVSNNFEYSVNENTSELLLSITDPEGNEITTLTGYDYVTADGISGFDVTNKTGLIEIANLYEILGSKPADTVQNWTAKLSFINLDADQTVNEGKSFNGEFILTDTKMISGAAGKIINNSDSTELVQHTPDISTSAGDNNWRFLGANPDNWVCLSNDLNTCSSNDLYRILGLYQDSGEYNIRLIKNTHATTYNYSLPAILSDLNTTYYNSLPNNVKNMIKPMKYSTGAVSTSDLTPKQLLEQESVSYSTDSYNVLGLHTSDYLFASPQSTWGNQNLHGTVNEINKTSNWIYDSINHQRFININLIIIQNNATIHPAYSHDMWVLKPVITLKNDVNIIAGIGTQSYPYYLGM